MTVSFPSRSTAALCLALAAVFVSSCKGRGAAGSLAASHDAGHDAGEASVAVGLPAPPDVAAPPDDAVKTASGLASKILVAGTGTEHPSRLLQKAGASGIDTGVVP